MILTHKVILHKFSITLLYPLTSKCSDKHDKTVLSGFNTFRDAELKAKRVSANRSTKRQ